MLECRTYAAQRALLWKALDRVRLPLTLQVLFGTLEGRKALQAYLLDTKICTAQWYYHCGSVTEDPGELDLALLTDHTPHNT